MFVPQIGSSYVQNKTNYKTSNYFSVYKLFYHSIILIKYVSP